MSVSTQTRQDVLAEQLSAATDTEVMFYFEPRWPRQDEQGKEIPGSEGHSWFVCMNFDGSTLDLTVSDLDGPILDQAIEYYEARHAELAFVLDGLRKYQADQAATD